MFALACQRDIPVQVARRLGKIPQRVAGGPTPATGGQT